MTLAANSDVDEQVCCEYRCLLNDVTVSEDDDLGSVNMTSSSYAEQTSLMDDSTCSQANQTLPPDDNFFKLVDKLESLFGHVSKPSEATLDAQVVKSLSRMCRQRGQGFTTSRQAFSLVEFGHKLRSHLDAINSIESDVVVIANDKWIELGRSVSSAFSVSPSHTMLHNCLQSSPDVQGGGEHTLAKRQRMRLKDDKNLIKTKTLDKSTLSSTAGGDPAVSTEKRIELIWTQLVALFKAGNRVPISYWHIVVHPTCFATTVENIFHMSFLVKEGKVRMSVPQDGDDGDTNQENRQPGLALGVPYVAPVSKRECHSVLNNTDSDERQQVVMNLSVGDWRKIVSAFAITKPLLR